MQGILTTNEKQYSDVLDAVNITDIKSTLAKILDRLSGP